MHEHSVNERPNSEVIVIGDSSNNTLGAIRSLGEAGVAQTLILVSPNDICHVQCSKYLKHGNCLLAASLEDCQIILDNLKSKAEKAYLMTTFDATAQWVDEREAELSRHFVTGGNLGGFSTRQSNADWPWSAACLSRKASSTTVEQRLQMRR